MELTNFISLNSLQPEDIVLEPSCSNRCIVNIEEDCKRLGLKQVPKMVAAPMVRYSKLPFRLLVRLYFADVVFSPMIYARNFIASEQCRNAEFSTCKGDESTIVQFASNDPDEFALAAMFVCRCSSGVNLNCGCPKRDVMKAGYGSKLLSNPELVADILAHTRRRLSDSNYSISIKIRICEDLRQTVELCRRAEKAGASFIAVHGRTPGQKGETPNYEAIRLVKSALGIPVFANGGVKTYQQALEVAKLTNADGIMVANGLLENPAMFAGHEYTPLQCVKDWIRLTAEHGSQFDLFHQQLIFMLRKLLPHNQRIFFNNLCNEAAVLDFLKTNIF